jgi:1-acyl-sn-glycerol-3-phosphate acyltransferase
MNEALVAQSSKTSLSKDAPNGFIIKLIKLGLTPLFALLWRVEYHNKENIPQDRPGGLILASNHQTYVDPFWIGLKVNREMRFMAWDKACNWPVVGPLIRKLGAFPVNLERGGKDSYKTAVRILREGATLVIFPEASREFADGKQLPFKTGTVRIAIEAGVSILPVTIVGGNKVWSQEAAYPGFSKVHIYYHPLLEIKVPEGMSVKEYSEQMTQRLAEIIGSVAQDSA